jgi:hypothetical protein
MVSIVFFNWKRPENLTQIIDTQSAYGCVSEFIVFNNSPVPFFHDKAQVLNSTHDFGLKCRWAPACFATSPIILLQDDDLILPEMTIRILEAMTVRDPHRIHGVFGRRIGVGYDRRNAYGACDIVLNRVSMFHRSALPVIIQCANDYRDAGYEIPHKNGEDIFMSYAVRSWHWKRPFAYRLPVVELPAGHALSDRPTHFEERVTICNQCKAFFAGRLPAA